MGPKVPKGRKKHQPVRTGEVYARGQIMGTLVEQITC